MRNMKGKLLLWMAAMLLVHGWLLWNLGPRLREGYSDFTIFYTAGKMVRQGMGSHLYDSAPQFRQQQEFAPRVYIRQGPLPYNHPPFEALLFVPLTFLSYFSAYLVWSGINLLVLVVVIVLIRPRLPELRKLPLYLWIVGLLAYFPIFLGLVQGQDAILLLLFYTLAFVALKKERDVLAGCWLALGLFKPHLVLPLALVLVLDGRRKMLSGFVSVAAVLTLLSASVVGWKGLLRYPQQVWQLEQSRARAAIAPSMMPNLRGLVSDIARVPEGTAWFAVLLISGSLLLLFIAARRRPGAGGTRELKFSLAAVATALVSYHLYSYDLSPLILPMLLVSDFVIGNLRSLQRRDKVLLLGPIFLLFLSPFYILFLLRLDHFSVMALVLLLWFWGISRQVRKGGLAQSTAGA